MQDLRDLAFIKTVDLRGKEKKSLFIKLSNKLISVWFCSTCIDSLLPPVEDVYSCLTIKTRNYFLKVISSLEAAF